MRLSLTDGMTNHPEDRHVLAAAVRANAEVIVTFNLNDTGVPRFAAEARRHLEPPAW
jgi:predicted nucleic acid-binding protein